jgi:hypothetical protein
LIAAANKSLTKNRTQMCGFFCLKETFAAR